MKWIRIIMALVCLACLGYVGKVLAQSTVNPITCSDVSVNSTTVPVNVLSPARITTYLIHVESTGKTGVLFFPYVGSTVPTAVPSPVAYMERAPGQDLPDAITCPASTCLNGMGQGWGAYLPAGASTAVPVDVCNR